MRNMPSIRYIDTIQYDTIRYDTVDLRALKSWRDGQLNLAHGPETKNNEKNQNQKPSSSEETVQAKVSNCEAEFWQFDSQLLITK